METSPDHFQQDAAAVFAVRGGEIERYRELVERHERQVFAVAWSRLGDASLAEEAAQETFIRGYQRLAQLADGAKFSGWIAALARNIATDLGLKHRRELDKRQRWAIEQAPPTAREETPDTPPETLQKTLAALSTEHRECLVLFYVEGKSGAETAASLGISETAFRMRLHRARKALREKLDEQLVESLRALRPENLLVPTVMAGLLATVASPAAKAAGAIGSASAAAQASPAAAGHLGQAAATPLTGIFATSTLALVMTKTTLTITAAVLIAAGTAVYWNRDEPAAGRSQAAGTDRSQAAGSDPAAAAARPDPSSTRSLPAKSVAREAREKAKTAFEEAMKGVDDVSTKIMVNYQRAKFEGQIQKLTQALSLNEEQESGLQAWLDGRMSAIATVDFEDEAAMSALLKSLTVPALDEELRKNLTDGQKAALGEFRESEAHKSVNAFALRELSLIQGAVEFEGDQQTRIYEILADDADKRLSRDAENLTAEMLLGDKSAQADTVGLGIDQALREAQVREPGKIPDHRKVVDDHIAAKIEQFRPVLNEAQLEQLRISLKAKTEESYGAMFDTMKELKDGTWEDE